MVSRRTFVCIECRVARKGYSASCGVNDHKMIDVGTRFRAPRKSDTKAWKRIEADDWYTEDSPVDIKTRKTQIPLWWARSTEFAMTAKGLVPIKGKKIILNKKQKKA